MNLSKKCIHLLIVFILVSLIPSAQAIKADVFMEQYNADVVKPSELLNFSLFKHVSDENGISTYKCYTTDEAVLAEVSLISNGDLYLFGLSATGSANEDEINKKYTSFSKAAMHTIAAGSPELSVEDALSVYSGMIQTAADNTVDGVGYAEYQAGKAFYRLQLMAMGDVFLILFAYYPTAL